MSEAELKKVVTQREYRFRSMQILYDLASNLERDPSKLPQFRSRCSKIENIREEFDIANTKINEIMLAIDPKVELDFQKLLAFDELYYYVLSEKDKHFSDRSTLRHGDGQDRNGRGARSECHPTPKLPKIELPKFDGKVENWPTFYDTYLSLIHQNSSIAPIEKFHYLLSCLSGPASIIARGIPVTSDNYQHVFDTLIERYQNKRLLAVTYIEKIQNFPQIKNSNLINLQQLYNTLYESINALKSLNIKNLDEFVLFHLAARALDSDTRKRFEIQNNSPIPSYSELITFLQDYVKVLETSQCKSDIPNPSPRSNGTSAPARNKPSESRQPYGQKRSALAAHTSPPATSHTCFCCEGQHSLYKCPKLQGLDIKARLSFVAENKLCINCLRKNHLVDKCFSKTRCQICRAMHHTMLHTDSTVHTPLNVENTSSSTPAVAHVGRNRDTALVLLGTCTVRVYDSSGTPHRLRALIDSSAQDCYLKTDCAIKLGFPIRRCKVTVAGIGENTVHQVKGTTQCTIQPCDSDNPKFIIRPIILDSITTKMPATELPPAIKERYRHLVLADENFDVPSEIQLLIGAELFHDIYDGQRVTLEPGFPVALHSVFGWILTGPVDATPPPITSSLLAATLSLEDVMSRFWEVEEPPQTPLCSLEDEECERLYKAGTYRESDGRYVVPILFKGLRRDLGDTYKSSLSRFLSLERRLSQHENLKSEYVKFMREYESLGHMSRTSDGEGQGKYFIPHHCVIKPDSATTKLRVVFNASSLSTNGLSLNDLVHTGPKLQADIVNIITGFRLHRIVFTCDISKMYRQILIRPEDRPWQHIFWRDSPTDPLRTYELRTVTYGVTSSPYLAIRTLHQLAQDHEAQWPRAAAILRHETFMDDIATGASSLEEANALKAELIGLLGCAQLELRKWTSNNSEFLSQLPGDHCQSPKTFSDENNPSTLKILGVQWEPQDDFFTYSSAEINVEYTKRSILSNVARLFDPLGWVNPYILKAKLLLQNLWRLRLSWDEPIPRDLAKDWHDILSDLKYLPLIRIPRQASLVDATDFQLIGFCDGSTKAYGCCVYLRSVVPGKDVQVNLLIAKSKVAPLKPLTVNRLELCGAVLLSRVLDHMNNLLRSKLNITQVIAFSDSSTVLAWLNTEPHKLKTFVAHRVVKITGALSANHWRHIASQNNPADHCSRGLSCEELARCDQWWSGPHWLLDDPSQWPSKCVDDSFHTAAELKSTVLVTQSVEPHEVNVLQTLIEKFSSLNQLKRVLAWCLRFITNTRCSRKQSSDEPLSGALSTTELDRSIKLLIKHVQASAFGSTIQQLDNPKSLPKHIRKLSPFVDSLGLLRVGGRIQNAEVSDTVKHPVLLPKKSNFSDKLVDFYHCKYLHCGPRALQSLIMREFWILGVRNLIRSRLAKCVICFKTKPKPYQPIMSPLPSIRLEQGSCFRNVGIDFGGPFIIKESRRRNAKTFKAYVCLFVCLSVTAVHLELVTELSTEAFIAALDRFISRRGLCHTIISDRGTNFVGAKRYLAEVTEMLTSQSSTISTHLASQGISWKLNPASASHFGGIFEAGIKSTKYHLKRVVGLQVLTFEEFYTILTKIEAMLNSRPLCELSPDPQELDVLTAGHFLIGRPLVALPEPVVDDGLSLRSRWQLLSKLSQSFWKLWQQDYLHTLQQRNKWYAHDQNVPSVGQLVMISEVNLPPTEWRVGRVVQTYPGRDGVIRVATIRTTKGLLSRPLVKLCPLPIPTN